MSRDATPSLPFLPLLTGALLLGALLAGCEPTPQPQLHDIYLFGPAPAGHSAEASAETGTEAGGAAGGAFRDVALSYFYGEPTRIVVDEREVALTTPDAAAADASGAADTGAGGPLDVPGALAVDGAPFLKVELAPRPAPATVQRIPLTTSLQLDTREPLSWVLYYDGSLWLTLARDVEAGRRATVTPTPRIGRLQGVGELSAAEAQALADYVESLGGPVVVSVLPGEALPKRAVDGLASYASSGFFLQQGLSTDAAAYRPPGEELVWEVAAQGGNALGVDQQTFTLVDDAGELAALWSRAHASLLTPPPLPEVNFGRETLLGVFAGTKPTGGYGLEVEGVTLEEGDLYVDLREIAPAPGAITTQALTSPWLVLRVLRGDLDVAWFRDAESGRLLGVARNLK